MPMTMTDSRGKHQERALPVLALIALEPCDVDIGAIGPALVRICIAHV